MSKLLLDTITIYKQKIENEKSLIDFYVRTLAFTDYTSVVKQLELLIKQHEETLSEYEEEYKKIIKLTNELNKWEMVVNE